MKIGILTFHRAENFGATLQAYALQTYLKEQGHQVFIIDYRCPAIETSYHILNPSILWSRKNVLVSLKQYIQRFFHLKDRLTKKKKYQTFWKKFYSLTEPVFSIKKDLGFDAYIVGSDQVWNLHLTHGIDNIYFLNFPKKKGVRNIAYAASSEYDPNGLICKHKDEIYPLLQNFTHLSVREKFLKDELERLFPHLMHNIHLCVDPTFLLNKDYYLKIAAQIPVKKKYILLYHMTPMQEGVRLAEKIAQNKGWSIIEIAGGYNFSKTDERYKQNLGPDELLGFIANAECVITTSFHGIALSVILQKELWVINKGDNLRQKFILQQLGLQNRMISRAEDYDATNIINYNFVESNLCRIVKESETYLNIALK